jgi:SAM-dependent methyltransferase
MKLRKYDRAFYLEQQGDSRTAAQEIVPLIMERFSPGSVVDVGCGVGTWLAAFRENGIGDVQGLDGGDVQRDLLQIPAERFRSIDLDGVYPDLGKRFDCALSLEVAEHLQPSSSRRFVEFLTTLSDVVVFSAAIPDQGGTGHINEQWLEYWAVLFHEFDYVPVDWLRPRIWTNEKIMWWYRQNLLTFMRQGQVDRYFSESERAGAMSAALSVIHPEFLIWAIQRRKLLGNRYHRDVGRYRKTTRTYLEAFSRR